jgi:ureidoglycolate hydrolase
VVDASVQRSAVRQAVSRLGWNGLCANRKGVYMPDMIPVKIRPLSGDTFRPYGQILERGALVYPEADDGRVALEMLRVRRRPHPHQIAQLAIHFSYNQTFIPVQGSLILVVAPAPDRQSADPSTYTFDYDHAAAFVVEPGQVAFIEKGVWHSLVPVGAECTFVNVTRKNAQEPATEEGNEARMERIHAVRPYVDYVDLAVRDQRVLALEW